MNYDWAPYFDIAERGLPYRERLRAYAAVARERLESDHFEAFCAEHLAHIEQVALEFFASAAARDAVRKKVAALFPAREIDEFTELFFGRIQRWREDQALAAR
jgi:hypothetical protein